jgi:hypothetical protein
MKKICFLHSAILMMSATFCHSVEAEALSEVGVILHQNYSNANRSIVSEAPARSDDFDLWMSRSINLDYLGSRVETSVVRRDSQADLDGIYARFTVGANEYVVGQSRDCLLIRISGEGVGAGSLADINSLVGQVLRSNKDVEMVVESDDGTSRTLGLKRKPTLAQGESISWEDYLWAKSVGPDVLIVGFLKHEEVGSAVKTYTMLTNKTWFAESGLRGKR